MRELIPAVLLLLTIYVGAFITDDSDPHECDHTECQQLIDTLRHWADALQYNQDSVLVPYIMDWEDHGRRMRMIAGYPSDTPITWQWKCVQPVDTRRIVGHQAVE